MRGFLSYFLLYIFFAGASFSVFSSNGRKKRFKSRNILKNLSKGFLRFQKDRTVFISRRCFRFLRFGLIFSLIFGPIFSQSASVNLYDKLGVSPSATQEEIEKAWKSLVASYHPDRHINEESGLSEDQAKYIFVFLNSKQSLEEIQAEGDPKLNFYKDLKEGFYILREPRLRKNYDEELKATQTDRLHSAENENKHGLFNQHISQAVLIALEELNRDGNKKSVGKGGAFQNRRNAIDGKLNKALEAVFLNANFNGRDGGGPLIIPEEVLSFPQSLSFLLKRGADPAFAPQGKKSVLETALTKIREPDAFREILRHNRDYINRKSSKGTPFFSLVLKKIRYSQNKAKSYQDSPSYYDSWIQTAQGWRDLADEILNEGVVDLSLTDGAGATALETAVTHHLNKIASRIYFVMRERGAEDLNFESGGGARLMRIADKAGNVQMLELFNKGADFEEALVKYTAVENTTGDKAKLRAAVITAGIILATTTFGIYVESGRESDIPLWLRSLPWSIVSFIPSAIYLLKINREENKKMWDESVREDVDWAGIGMKAQAVGAGVKTKARAWGKYVREDVDWAGIRMKAQAVGAGVKKQARFFVDGEGGNLSGKEGNDVDGAAVGFIGGVCGLAAGAVAGLAACAGIFELMQVNEWNRDGVPFGFFRAFGPLAVIVSPVAGGVAGAMFGSRATRACYNSFKRKVKERFQLSPE